VALSGPIDAAAVEALARGERADDAQELVQLAWSGRLKGVVKKKPRFSATTIQWHADCARKYYWPTVAGLEEPQSGAQGLGQELHKHAELWLAQGKPPPQTTAMGRLAAKGLSMLPPPKSPGLHVEDPFEILLGLKIGAVLVTGTIDLWIEPPTKDAVNFKLGDHKTAGTSRYPKSREWLSNNIQSNLYAWALWTKLQARGFESLKTVSKQWNYFYKKEQTTAPLRVVDSLAHVAQQMEEVIQPNLTGMARMVRDTPSVGDIPPAADPKVCESYGGCKHWERCFGKESRGMGALSNRFSKQALAEKAKSLPPPKGAGAKMNPPKPPPAPEEEEETLETQGAEGEEVAEEQQEQEAAPVSKAKPKPAKAKPVKVEETEEAEETPAPRTKRGASLTTPGTNSEHSFWLFYGCAPTAGFEGEVIHIEKLVGTAQANAADAAGSQHYRYGQSYGALEAAFAAWMDANAIVGAVVVDPNSIVARDVVGLLRAHATVVIERVG
jgi:hypothetical protein